MVRFLWKYVRQDPSALLINIFFVFLQIIMQTVFMMKEMKNIIDEGVGKQDMNYILYSGTRMIIFTLLVGVCTVFASYFSARVTAGASCRIREDCYKKVVSFSPQDYGKFGESTLLNRTVTDTTQIQLLLINLMRTSMMVPVIIICMLVLIFRMNKVLFTILFVVFVLTIFVLVVFGTKSKPYFEALQKKIDYVNLLMKEKITGVRAIRAFGNEKLEEEKMERTSEEVFQSAVRANNKINFLSPVSMIMINWAVVLIYLASSSQLRMKMASVSDLLLIFQYLGYFITCLAVVPLLVSLVPKVSVSCNRINELLPADVSVGKSKADSNYTFGDIVFDDVIFGYAGATDVVTHVSFTIPTGKTTAFIGTTGSGKTTIMNLIMGFYAPTFGDIQINGCSLRSIDLNEYRTHISYATQKAFVFQDTAKNNITMYDRDITAERLACACQSSCFDEVVDKMPNGIDTVMSPGGTNISGGQRQRLSLARTVAKNAEIYIFDDTFSALDTITEKKSRQQIKKMLDGKTVIMVAQKIDTIKEADQIIVLDKGKITGTGRHDELLNSCKEYRDIYETQSYLSGRE